MKKILGLDLGTNSIGWALIQQDCENKQGEILGMGTRVIPMSQDILGDFGKGNSVSQTAERTRFRSTRRLRERHLLRRERLHRVLNILGFLPEQYASQIDFEKRLGKFKDETEPKLAYNGRDFIFRKSFEEMLTDFKQSQPELLNRKNKKGELAKIPYDWTIYYLRTKALSKKIEKEELSWILLNFNQKRGYFQLRGTEEEFTEDDSTEVLSLKVLKVVKGEKDKKYNKYWHTIDLEGGYNYQAAFYGDISGWTGTIRDFVITKEALKDGTTKFRISSLPTLDEIDKLDKKAQNKLYGKIKIKTENEIDKSKKTVGTYIYDTLLQNPKQKIKGKLVRTIERKFYKDELRQILQKQKDFHPELHSDDLYNDCIRELYRNNEAHQFLLSSKDFVHLFLDDIIFYQRPLRSQKSSIGNCTLEYRKYKDETGSEHMQYLKVILKSNPYYQEFRIWQWVYNLSIYKKEDDSNVTAEFLSSVEDWENLFDFLNNRREIEQKPLIKYFLEKKGLKGKVLSAEVEKYRWNYVEDKKYPCNETKTLISTRLEKVENVPDGFLTRETEQKLWHIIYSVTDKTEYDKALKSFAIKNQLDEVSFVEAFRKCPPFKSEYGSYSEKAIKNLLPLMRLGEYWSWDKIDEKSRARIEKILTGEYDESIKNRVREKALHLTQQNDFQGLQLWLAQYIVYGRHSEAAIAGKWNSADDLEQYLEDFKQHSLRNPIVEQVVTETLRVVKDIWVKYGNGAKDFFDEIHIELGREMKNTADDRKEITKRISENENTNLRIKALLAEMIHYNEVENVSPFSPMQQEILKVYEEGVLNSNIEIGDDILKISKAAQPSSVEIKRYKLWLEQKYRSPYTGEIIPLNKLFTLEYEIEHIIPQSRYFDDSFSNKVICEAAVNKLKDNQLGYAFIKNHHGEKVQFGNKTVQIFAIKDYEDFVKEHYAKNRGKRNRLLMEEIPDKMIERQMNDTRYISKFISSVLSNIVRAETNDDGVNSKNLIPGNGKITNELKQDWGLNDVWNELILPRFERMNLLTNSTHFTAWNENHQKFLPTVPLELSKGFSKKRIDHRHHAMDALVIACATKDHINLLNNKHAKSKERFDLNRKLRRFEKIAYNHPQTGERVEKEVPRNFSKPWANFIADARNALENIVVSFKQNLRVINKATNHYEKWVEKDGIKVKELQEQKGTNWAIRKPMHKDTVSGLVQLRKKKTVSLNAALDNVSDIADKNLRKEIQSMQAKGLDKKKINKHFKDADNLWNGQDISRVEFYYWEKDNVASRVSLNDTFDEKRIETITDTGIQRILLSHLNNYKGRLDEKGKEIAAPLLAFSPEGIEEMNKNIITLNNGKSHQPILKVRTYEPKGNKFNVGQTGNKKKKYVEAAKGTNLFFAIYQDTNGKRNYETISLNIVIERQKQGLSSVPLENEKGDKLLFHLSPNDLVYVPTEDELANQSKIDFTNLSKEQVKRIYKFTDGSGVMANFIPATIAEVIFNMNEKKQKEKNIKFLIKNGGEVDSDSEGKDKYLQNEVGVGSQGSKKERAFTGEMMKESCIKLKVYRLGNIMTANHPKNHNHPQSSGDSNVVNEPSATYSSFNKITIFQSIEEENEHTWRQYASMTPEESLAAVTRMRLNTFPHLNTNLKPWGNTLYFD